MARWHNRMEKLTSFTQEPSSSIDEFFKLKNYQPETDEEKQMVEEFSLITSSMAILIHVAKADKSITPQEKKQIINDIVFQMEERPYEFSKLVEKFGNSEKGIIENVYDKMLEDYKNSKVKIDKIIDDICVIYQNNPAKRYYLIRLCYYVALSDNSFNQHEEEAIKELATKMNVPNDELKRIEEEVKADLSGK